MVVPAREPASLGTSTSRLALRAEEFSKSCRQLSFEVNQSVVLLWGRREGNRRLGAACLLSSVMPSPPYPNALVYFIGKLSAGFGELFSSKGEPARARAERCRLAGWNNHY